MAIEVVPLTEADIPGTILVIQKAFADDPYFKWVFDASKFDKGRNRGSLAARCQWGINNALFYIAKETTSQCVLGVSCWLAPQTASEPQSWYGWYQDWLLSFRQWANNVRHLGRGGLNVRRYWIWKARQAEAQKEIWVDPRGYYFCNIVAVSPIAQGKGIGRMLFEAVTDQADREGIKCYLESSKSEPNVKIYERMGFEIIKELDCKDGDDVCKLYCMVRNPKVKL